MNLLFSTFALFPEKGRKKRKLDNSKSPRRKEGRYMANPAVTLCIAFLFPYSYFFAKKEEEEGSRSVLSLLAPIPNSADSP